MQNKILNSNKISDYPSMHDKLIRCIYIIDKNNSILCFGNNESEEACLVLREVDRLRACNFRHGNIVLDVDISLINNNYLQEIAHLYDIEIGRKIELKEKAKKLASQDKIIISISPSYGCEFLCVCASAEFVPGSLIECVQKIHRI